MKQDAEYHRNYREKSRKAIEADIRVIENKIDRILEILGCERKIVIPVPVPKPFVQAGTADEIGQYSKGVGLEPITATVQSMGSVLDEVKITACRCGGKAFYQDDKGIYCPSHSPRDAKPI